MAAISTITAPETGLIADVDVTLKILHTYPGDLIVTLEGPDRTKVVLANRYGGATDDVFFGTTFDQAAATWIGHVVSNPSPQLCIPHVLSYIYCHTVSALI